MARRIVLAGSVLGAGLVASALAIAAPKGVNLGDTKRWQELDAQLQKKVQPLNQACGTSLDAAYDAGSYEGKSTDDARAGAYCPQSFDTLKTLCGTDAGKTAVKARVKHFVCRFSTDGTKVTLDGDKLIIHIDPKRTGIEGKKPGSYNWKSAIEEVL